MAVCVEKEFEVASQVVGRIVGRIYIAQVRLATVLLSINVSLPPHPPKFK